MERRELLGDSIGALVFGAVPDALTRERGISAPAEINDREAFYHLLDEARAAFYSEEYRRAFDLYTRALGRIPPGQPSAVHAEILNNAENTVARHRAGIGAKQPGPMAHYWFAFTLSRAGRNEEALVQYQKALALGCEARDACWLGIGLNHYRQGRYEDALRWFEQIELTDEEELANLLGVSTYRMALEHWLVVYSKLGRAQTTEAITKEYVRR